MELWGHPHAPQLVSHACGLGSALFHLLPLLCESSSRLMGDQAFNIHFSNARFKRSLDGAVHPLCCWRSTQTAFTGPLVHPRGSKGRGCTGREAHTSVDAPQGVATATGSWAVWAHWATHGALAAPGYKPNLSHDCSRDKPIAHCHLAGTERLARSCIIFAGTGMAGVAVALSVVPPARPPFSLAANQNEPKRLP